MRMNQNERRFDFHGLGAALKRAREEKGWTQAYVAELVDRDSRTIMNIENKGQYPSFDLFVKLIMMFDISVDQFIHADGGAQTSSCRKHIDVLLNSMNEKELVVIEATAEGIKKARETEDAYESVTSVFLRHVAEAHEMASNSGVATLRNFCWPQARKNACWGAPQTR